MTDTRDSVIAFLINFNKWRRGDEDIKQPDPKEIGENIDAAIKMLTALQAGAGDAQVVPAGWALVPIEPSWDMRNEGREFLIDGLEKDPEKLAYFLWKTMVKASPLPPQPKCRNCNGHGEIGYTTGQTPESFEQGSYPCPDCNPQPKGDRYGH